MRNLKKLFAVVMVVAMLASMMVPALAAGVEYEDEATILQDLGLFQGYGAGELGLADDLTREQGLALMLRVMGLEDEVKAMTEEEVAAELARVVDPETVTATWAKPYVAYAVKNGLTKGIDASILPNVKFAGQLKMTGKEFINLMLNGMGYATAWDDVLTKAAEVEMLSAGESVTFGTVKEMTRDDAVAIMTGALTGITSEGISLAQALVDAGAVDADKMEEYGFIVPEVVPTEAPVEVTAEATTTNLIQINVEFSAEVDKDSAEDEGNYDISKVKIAGAALQEDGRTVVLTLEYDSARGQQAAADLTVKGVKDVDGEEIDEFTIEDIEFLDTTIPTVVDAFIVGNDTIKVVFSEPMKGTKPVNGVSELNKNDFSVNNGKSYVRNVKLQNNYTEALIELYSTLKEGEITLQVKSGSEDFAGFGVIGRIMTLEVVPDEEAPVVIGYEKAKRTEVTLIWNEDIEFNKNFNFKTNLKDRENFYHTNSKNPVRVETEKEGKIENYSVKIDGNKMTLYFADDTKLPNGTAYVYVMKEAVRDLWDNENSQQMIEVAVEVDDTPPSVDKVEATDENVLEITFSEDVKEDSAKKKDNYTILDDEGDEIDNIIRKVERTSSKKVTITFKEDLSGDYAVVIKNIEDLEGNKMATETVPFTVGDITPPDAGKFEATLYNSEGEDQMIKVNFKDVMATEGNYAVTDVEKYVILKSDDSEKGKLEDINGVRIVVTDDGKAVEIYVPSKVDADDKDAKSGKDYLDIVSGDKIRIARVADAADNKMELMIKDITLKVSDLIKVNSVKAVARDTVEIAFDDELVIFEASDIVIAKVAKDPSKLKDNELYEIAGVDTKLKDGKTVAVFTLDDDDLLDFNVNNGGNGLYVYVIPTVEVKDGDDKTESENKYNKTLQLYDTAEKALKAEDKIAPKLYNDGEDTDYAQSDGEIAHVKDYLAFKSTVIDGVYFFDATIYFSEEIGVYDSKALLAGNDFDITLDGDKLVNGKDYFVEKYGKVDDKEVGFVTIRFIGKDIKDDPDDKELKTGKKFEGDLSIGLVEKPQYLMDPRENVIADFDAIELDNLEVIRKY